MPQTRVETTLIESGPCALTTCDEERDSCYQPDSFVCSTVVEKRCKPIDGKTPKCPGVIQQRTTTTQCSGTSADCSGTITSGNFVFSEDCGGICNADTITCQPTVQCSTACDDSTNLCWTNSTDEPTSTGFADAAAYCESLITGGSNDWRLPTIDEWLQLAKGCDEASGESQPVSFQSTCTFDPGDDNVLAICETYCPLGEGPTDGCYWPAVMDACIDRCFAQSQKCNAYCQSIGQYP